MRESAIRPLIAQPLRRKGGREEWEGGREGGMGGREEGRGEGEREGGREGERKGGREGGSEMKLCFACADCLTTEVQENFAAVS